MMYIEMNEQEAIGKGVIPADHYFPKGDEKVIFKNDVLTVFKQKGNHIDFEFEELNTQTALKTIERWN